MSLPENISVDEKQLTKSQCVHQIKGGEKTVDLLRKVGAKE